MLSTSYLAVAIVIMGMITKSTPRTVENEEILNNVQNPVVEAPNFSVMLKSMEDTVENSGRSNLCQIEYQVTRRKTGQCVKLGQGMTGCVSGQYLNPFHPDCV